MCYALERCISESLPLWSLQITGRMDFIKFNFFFIEKTQLRNQKGKPQSRRKYLQSVSDRLLSRIYKELLQLSKTNKPILKIGKALGHFTKEDTQMANKHHGKQLNTISHKGSASEGWGEIPPHPPVWLKLKTDDQVLTRMGSNWKSHVVDGGE